MPTLRDDLSALLEFGKTIEATRAGRRDHPSLRSGQVVGASGDLQAVAAEIKKHVRALDGMVRYRFGDNTELMRAWRSVRNVLGPFRSRAESDAGRGETLRGAQGRPPKAA